MSQLLAFLRRARLFFLFIFLQILCFVVYFQTLVYPNSVFISGASSFSGTVLGWSHDITSYFDLDVENERLAHENAELRRALKNSQYALHRDSTLVNDARFHQQYTYIPATVIQSSCSQRNNYFTLDVGSLQGIKPGMGVISPRGVVGVVYNVGEHFCLVKTVLTHENNTNVLVGKQQYLGILKWDGKSPTKGTITGVSRDFKISIGCNVYTRGGDGIYPKGIYLGRVSAKQPIEEQSLWNLELSFWEDYRNLSSVYVVVSPLKQELVDLNNKIPSDTN
jgi:rod shape-determining protein MreC